MEVRATSSPEKFVLQFVELEGPDGGAPRTISLDDFTVEPLGYAELAAARLNEKLTIPLRLRRGSVVASDIPEFDTAQRYDVTATLESRFTSRAIGLVHRGWLPSALAVVDPQTTIFVDRNVVTQIVSRFSGGAITAPEPDFLDLFADHPVRINPLLYVLEGNARTAPDLALAQQQLEEVLQKLRAALPKAALAVGPQSLAGVMGLLADSRASLARKTDFLLRLAPALASPVSARRRQQRWDEVIATARACEVPLTSLVVLAALSAAAIPNGQSPSRRLLKFKPDYRPEDAYNALVDLRSLELFMAMMSLYPTRPIQLCTGDRDMALFWVGARASGYRQIPGGFAFDLSPRPELLPDDYAEQWAQLVQTVV